MQLPHLSPRSSKELSCWKRACRGWRWSSHRWWCRSRCRAGFFPPRQHPSQGAFTPPPSSHPPPRAWPGASMVRAPGTGRAGVTPPSAPIRAAANRPVEWGSVRAAAKAPGAPSWPERAEPLRPERAERRRRLFTRTGTSPDTGQRRPVGWRPRQTFCALYPRHVLATLKRCTCFDEAPARRDGGSLTRPGLDPGPRWSWWNGSALLSEVPGQARDGGPNTPRTCSGAPMVLVGPFRFAQRGPGSSPGRGELNTPRTWAGAPMVLVGPFRFAQRGPGSSPGQGELNTPRTCSGAPMVLVERFRFAQRGPGAGPGRGA
jgi:hypothetical protein